MEFVGGCLKDHCPFEGGGGGRLNSSLNDSIDTGSHSPALFSSCFCSSLLFSCCWTVLFRGPFPIEVCFDMSTDSLHCGWKEKDCMCEARLCVRLLPERKRSNKGPVHTICMFSQIRVADSRFRALVRFGASLMSSSAHRAGNGFHWSCNQQWVVYPFKCR